jgi:hypothetical protein
MNPQHCLRSAERLLIELCRRKLGLLIRNLPASPGLHRGLRPAGGGADVLPHSGGQAGRPQASRGPVGQGPGTEDAEKSRDLRQGGAR